MRCNHTALLLAPTLAVACAGGPDPHTLAALRDVEPDVAEVRVEKGLDQAMLGYRTFLESTPESSLTPEAMRRLADLKLEKAYGIFGDGEIVELPAPEATPVAEAEPGSPRRPQTPVGAHLPEAESDFERRATHEARIANSSDAPDLELPGSERPASSGPLAAIELYDRILTTYPTYRQNDQVLYQKSRAYDELGRTDEAIAVMERLAAEYPDSRHIDEVQFRRAEYFFTRRKYRQAEDAYSAVTARGAGSEYYELALYKLGWTFYKQDVYDEALDQYMALLDYKVSIGYDFDQSQDEEDERRIADTYRVISLAFSNLGGPDAVEQYFAAKGSRSYEDRIYGHLGEFYLEKLRYHDAAAAYQAFVDLHPLHRTSPRFGMRVVQIYEAGGFPKLVLESKKDFAARYGLESEYWRHFDVDDAPEVLSYLKNNLEDLAGHYHARYQNADFADQQPASFQEASRWYRAYLTSFPADAGTPAMNHRLADLLLENGHFGEAAREYERTAYEYPEHERAGAAGYAAIYAHRQNQKHAAGADPEVVRREAVTSTLRFVDGFPDHEHAAAVLGAAVDDLYAMKEFPTAIATGRRLIDGYPQADPTIQRAAWTVVAHASFDVADYPGAEQAYARVLEMTPEEDASRRAVVDTLAAAIYKQGEQANLAGDARSAADHFLRVARAAPSSEIAPLAEYDAGAALIRLEDWAGAATALDSLRRAFPDHELNREATRQLAFVYRQEGNLSRAAGEYERVAAEAEDPELRREALLLAGELYEDSGAVDRALAVYLDYVAQFPAPLETAAETHSKIAKMYDARRDESAYHEQLRRIVELDAAAGDARTPRIRGLAAQAALVLSEQLYHRFAAIDLVQPFDQNLQEKQRRMNAALEAFGRLVDYEVGEVTAAATFYMAEVYSAFSQALIDSERPADLAPAEQRDYETALEEEAFPFEERAIEVHQKNLELLASGVYNPWIDRSLARLAELVPGRYAKFEASSGWIASLDGYAYRAPHTPGTGADATVVEAAPGVPASVADDAVVLDATNGAESPGPASQADPGSEAPLQEGEEGSIMGVSDANVH